MEQISTFQCKFQLFQQVPEKCPKTQKLATEFKIQKWSKVVSNLTIQMNNKISIILTQQ